MVVNSLLSCTWRPRSLSHRHNSLQALMLKQLHRGSCLSSPRCPQHREQCETEQVEVSWMSKSLLRVTLLNFSPILLGAV